MAKDNNVIMEGRDITTVVFPEANYKFYLDASLEERVNRRLKQNQEKGIDMSYEEIYENIKARDYNDMHKEIGSLVRTDEQIYIDSTNMTIDEVVEKIKEISVEIGKDPVQVEEAPGFVVNRILIPMINEAVGIYADGLASVEGIDTAMKLGANHPMGPLALGDLVGLDIELTEKSRTEVGFQKGEQLKKALTDIKDSFDYIIKNRRFLYDSISREYDKNIAYSMDFFRY